MIHDDCRIKTVRAAERYRKYVAKARDDWSNEQKKPKPERSIFVDETWASMNMSPRYGRAPNGRWVQAMVPHGHWKTTTFIAALRHDPIDAPCVFDGPLNGDCSLAPPRAAGRVSFTDRIERALAPTLRPGDVVIIDNLCSHKVSSVREAIEARGATLLYLPPYSADSESIEQLFAKLKHFLRSEEARTVQSFNNSVGRSECI